MSKDERLHLWLLSRFARDFVSLIINHYTQHGHNLDFLGRCPRLY
jgi:hypothetical protein